jgi:hypothetical protein
MIERRERRAHSRPVHQSKATTFFARIWSLVAYSDTTPTRFMLAIAASSWSLMLALPGDTFERPVYRYMALVGPEWAWAWLWGFHAAGMWWRTFSDKPRPIAALLINMLGVMLFTSSAISIFLSLTYPLPAAVAADVVFALAAFWVLIRTHVNNASGWRID